MNESRPPCTDGEQHRTGTRLGTADNFLLRSLTIARAPKRSPKSCRHFAPARGLRVAPITRASPRPAVLLGGGRGPRGVGAKQQDIAMSTSYIRSSDGATPAR